MDSYVFQYIISLFFFFLIHFEILILIISQTDGLFVYFFWMMSCIG